MANNLDPVTTLEAIIYWTTNPESDAVVRRDIPCFGIDNNYKEWLCVIVKNPGAKRRQFIDVERIEVLKLSGEIWVFVRQYSPWSLEELYRLIYGKVPIEDAKWINSNKASFHRHQQVRPGEHPKSLDEIKASFEVARDQMREQYQVAFQNSETSSNSGCAVALLFLTIVVGLPLLAAGLA